MYRSTGDINDSFESFRDISASQIDKLGYSAPSCFNDIDMLTVGMYGKGNVGTTGCDDTDYRTQFAIWCMFSSPLMIGCDVRNMTPAAKALLTNKELIAINQDPEARSPFLATQHPWNENLRVYMKHLADNEYAIGFFNLSDRDSTVPFYPYNAGLTANSGYGLEMKNIFTGEAECICRDYMNPKVEKHGCLIYKARLVKI